MSNYRAISQILDKEDTSGTGSTDINIGGNISDITSTDDGDGTGGIDNNSDSKNAQAKASLSTYNVLIINPNADTSANAGDTTGKRDVSSTGDADNNNDSKNAYAKAGLNIYNVANANVDVDTSAANTSGMGEKVSNNTNNTKINQFDRGDRVDKGGLSRTNNCGVGRTDIEIKVGLDGANKGRISAVNKGGMDRTNKGGIGGANKGGVSGTNIEAGKKASTKIVVSTDNSADDSNKVINQHASLVSLLFAIFSTTNYFSNSNLVVLEETPLGTTIFTSNKFLITFAAFANTSLEKKPKLCKSNPFIFAVNHQYQPIDITQN